MEIKKKKLKAYICKNGNKMHNILFNRNIKRTIIESKKALVFREGFGSEFQSKAVIIFKNRKAFFYLVKDKKLRQCQTHQLAWYLKKFLPWKHELGVNKNNAKRAQILKILRTKANKHKLVEINNPTNMCKKIDYLYGILESMRENDFFRQKGFTPEAFALMQTIKTLKMHRKRFNKSLNIENNQELAEVYKGYLKGKVKIYKNDFEKLINS